MPDTNRSSIPALDPGSWHCRIRTPEGDSITPGPRSRIVAIDTSLTLRIRASGLAKSMIASYRQLRLDNYAVWPGFISKTSNSGTSLCNSLGRPVKTGKVAKCIGMMVLACSNFAA